MSAFENLEKKFEKISENPDHLLTYSSHLLKSYIDDFYLQFAVQFWVILKQTFI